LTGIDTFNFLRNKFPIPTRTIKKFYSNNGKDFQEASKDDRFIFVIMSNLTNITLVRGFGFHGDVVLKNLNTCYMLPSVFFYIPILREILLLSGAVSFDDERISEMLRNGRSVVYAPNGMEDVLYINEDENDFKDHPKQPPPVSVFDLAVEKHVKVIPCVISGEDKKFFFLTFPLLKRVQKYFMGVLGYPFPFIFFPNRKEDAISISFGTPAIGKTKIEMSNNFHEQVKQLQNSV
jgi:voltage-gated potassium channel Kch